MRRRLALALLGAALLTGCEFQMEGQGSGGGAGYGIDPVVATDANFDQLVLRSSQPVMIDCYADWCGPCQALKPAVHQLAAEYEGRAIISQLDIDANYKIMRQYNIQVVPTLLFFKHGKLVSRIDRAAPKAELAAKLDALLTDVSVAVSP